MRCATAVHLMQTQRLASTSQHAMVAGGWVAQRQAEPGQGLQLRLGSKLFTKGDDLFQHFSMVCNLVRHTNNRLHRLVEPQCRLSSWCSAMTVCPLCAATGLLCGALETSLRV